MKIRIITAIVAILLFFPFVIYGDWPFQVIMVAVSGIGFYELLKMRHMTRFYVPMFLSMFLMFTFLLPRFAAVLYLDDVERLLLITLLLLSYTVLVKNQFTIEDAGFMLITATYVGVGFHYFIETQMIGLHYIFYVIIIILATDTGAYFSGRQFGKHKLWPEISPNKTIEGALGGILLAVVVSVVFHLFFPVHESTWVVVIASLLASMVAQIGDLVESAYKRYYSVKDSGRLLPGHGGILDRFDSWLFVFPFLHMIQFIS
ncbi:phosphatidate cytidylyltransferase [Pelagirhabdus alkalitolerans]|uniref:Phosphatidate cytidylyltransferase n=1 Tax=Pelagirhabdus alkalitolerans TaxID=1612202 RepID=A0A1G6H3Y8_9BACI|nr:phosphatidate cytidylyltransferase [Pelagirhabdus alkalitolerans]SDB88989.1 phosphatidate cytidylyltransferase [Pelagirhabdus alkalitolerans]